jgi:flavin-binding protein dodecin
MAVARITQVIGSSPHSWEDAVRSALERANRTLRGITGIEVQKENGVVQDGQITEFRATVQVTFVLED